MRLTFLILVVMCALVAAGCESTFDQAVRAREAAGTVAEVNALDMTQVAGVKATTLAILPSADGTTAAIVVKVEVTQPGQLLLWVPIEVRLLDATGAEVGTNNIPGALPILVHLASAVGGTAAYYVNDQILLSGVPASAEVVIGGKLAAGSSPGELQLSAPVLTPDPDLGDSWTTTVTNTTGVRQEQLVVQAIVRDGDRIIGAGTANIDGLEPGASVDVTGYFIGASKGVLEVFAPASNAADGSGAPGTDAGGGATTGSDSGGEPSMTLQVG